MDKTLDELPGEGETRTIEQIQVRKDCEKCGEVAHYRYTFLLNGTRSNSASKAYRRDDCSWCSDLDIFGCKTCKIKPPDGYVECSTFPASERFKHMFLYWKTFK